MGSQYGEWNAACGFGGRRLSYSTRAADVGGGGGNWDSLPFFGRCPSLPTIDKRSEWREHEEFLVAEKSSRHQDT